MDQYDIQVEEIAEILQQAQEELLSALNHKKDFSEEDLKYLQSRLHRYKRIGLHLNRIAEFREWMEHHTGDVMTLEEISEVMHVTRERVRQVEVSALKKIKHPNLGRIFREYCKISIRPSSNQSEFCNILEWKD